MSTGLVTIVPKYARIGTGFSRRERAEANFHPGRRTDGSQSPATWLTELSDRRQIIILCQFCQPRFNARRNGYRRWYAPSYTPNTDPHQVNGRCDACKQDVWSGGRGYVSEETYAMVCTDPADARRISRTAWRRTSVWDAVRQVAARAWGSRASREGAA